MMYFLAVMPINGNFRVHRTAIAAFCRAVFRSNDLISMHEAMPEKARDSIVLSAPGDPMP